MTYLFLNDLPPPSSSELQLTVAYFLPITSRTFSELSL